MIRRAILETFAVSMIGGMVAVAVYWLGRWAVGAVL